MEECLQVIGNNGIFQKNIVYICILASLLTTVYTLIISFLTKQPDFFVINRAEQNGNSIKMSYSKELCDHSKYKITKDIESIHNWTYAFDLYCNREYLNTLVIYSILFGQLLGTVLLSPIPDKYGRKTIFKIIIAVSLIIHINLIILFNPYHVMISNILGGITSFAYTMGFYIIIEYIRSDLTGFVLGLFNAIYPLFGVFLGFFFLTINNFRILFAITAFLSIILTYITFKYFTESPRWLHSMGKRKECLEVFTFIAKVNGKEKEWNDFQKKNPKIINKIGEKQIESSDIKKNYNIVKILGFPSQRKKIILLCCLWFASGMNFFGILLNLGHMKGNFFMNSILSFSGEVISELGSGYLADIKGRIWVMKYSAYLGSLSLLTYKFVGINLKSIFVMGSMFGYAAIYNVLGIYVPENFPVFIRGNVTGFLIILLRFSPMLVPYLTSTLGQNVDYVFIILGFFAGFILNFSEETFGKPIIDHIPEEEDENLKYKFLSDMAGKGIKLNDVIFSTPHSSMSFKVK